MANFIWGNGGQKLTPEMVASLRSQAALAARNAGDTSPVAHWSAGVSRLVDALGGVLDERRANTAEQAGSAEADSIMRALMGQSYAPSYPASYGDPAPTVGSPPVPTGDMASYVRDGLIQRGLPEHVADAFVLNGEDESGLNPTINEISPTVPGSRGGYGLMQWTGPRRDALERFAVQRGSFPGNVDTQLDYLMQELQGPESAAASKILAAPDTGSAAAAVVNNFLRPAEQNRARREAAYLGGAQPQQGGVSSSPAVMSALMEAANNAWVQKKYGPVINALMQQDMARQNAVLQQQLKMQDPSYQLQQRKLAAEVAALENPQPKAVRGMNINGKLVNPETGAVIADFSEPKDGFRLMTPDEAKAVGIPAGQVGPDGRIYPINPPAGMTVEMGPDGTMRVVQGSGAGGGQKPLTETQSKDVGYATRMEGALATLDSTPEGGDAPLANALTSRTGQGLGMIPFGLGRGAQSKEYQLAKAAGDEFLMALLRKDTGASITSDERRIYGGVYLPQPGDSAEVLSYKAEARRRSMEGLKAGMSPQQIEMQAQAMEKAIDDMLSSGTGDELLDRYSQ